MQAAASGATDCVALLIARGGNAIDVDAVDADGLTALHWAVDACNTEITCLLLQAGANPTTMDKKAAPRSMMPKHGI